MDIDERILQRHDIAGSQVDLCSYCGRAIAPGSGKRIAAGRDGIDDDLVACIECWQAYEVGALPLDADAPAGDPRMDE
jgi:hypothetical protein